MQCDLYHKHPIFNFISAAFAFIKGALSLFKDRARSQRGKESTYEQLSNFTNTPIIHIFQKALRKINLQIRYKSESRRVPIRNLVNI